MISTQDPLPAYLISTQCPLPAYLISTQDLLHAYLISTHVLFLRKTLTFAFRITDPDLQNMKKTLKIKVKSAFRGQLNETGHRMSKLELKKSTGTRQGQCTAVHCLERSCKPKSGSLYCQISHVKEMGTLHACAIQCTVPDACTLSKCADLTACALSKCADPAACVLSKCADPAACVLSKCADPSSCVLDKYAGPAPCALGKCARPVSSQNPNFRIQV
ncbi:hypothetical protein L1987_24241 [Smallanthus sonchifolius]|uniref:Uncharacterized protein n=1 Tax=Smallanthus sonchifolius TaxID=185202 RepID=A0ACB9IKH3_9ASTR|nr:hypothetical protein L1987_24241 [Smallanthus sonchifolius]